MIEIDINGQKYNVSEINEGFLIEQVRRRQEDGLAVCIRIHIDQNGVNLTLSCGECGGGRVGGRQPGSAEQEILDLWNRIGCGGSQINPGKLVAFLNQVKR